jgi:serine O-acetyltransferase
MGQQSSVFAKPEPDAGGLRWEGGGRPTRDAGVRQATSAVASARFLSRLLDGRRAALPVMPLNGRASRFADELLRLLFPHFSQATYDSAADLEAQFGLLLRDLTTLLSPLASRIGRPVSGVVEEFGEAIPNLYDRLRLDATAIHQGDPAAGSVDEVIAAYPGFLAIAIYRVAHEFYRAGVPVFPRVLTEYGHQKTGIDIHPGARIGASFCIDHGTGVVVGETTEIGDHVKLYQGVTLGALSVDKSLADTKRHPTIEDRVIIYSNATVLGGATRIGHDSVIGGNVWLTRSVPPFSVVYQRSEINVRNLETEHHVRSDASSTGEEP